MQNNTALEVIQGHRGRHQSERICDFLWWIVTDIQSCTVSELSQLIVQILDTAFWATLWGLRGKVRCSSWAHWKARSGLSISVNWIFSLGVTAESLRAKRDRKSAISFQRGNFDRKFQVGADVPYQ